MTTNQINYWKNVETERSNRRNEQIKAHEADTKRLAYNWQKEYDTHRLKLAAAQAGIDFVKATTGGYKDFTQGMKNQMSSAGDVARIFG